MKTKKNFPSYHINSPRYPSLAILYDNLAYQDAGFQSNQIVLDFFFSYMKDNQIDTKEFIRTLAKEYKISAGTEDLLRVKKIMAESYLVQTYNIAELFFKEFNKVYRVIHGIEDWKTTERVGNSDKKLDPLNQLLKNIHGEKSGKLRRLPEYLLCDYYRLLRNGYVHREIVESVSMKKPAEFFNKNIVGCQDHFKQYFKVIPVTGIPAPNPPSLINFQDFIIYSRALRNLANFINELCSFSVKQAFEYAQKDANFLRTPKKINYHKFPHSKSKLDTYLRKYYVSKYGNTEDQILEFLALFYQKY